MTDEMVFAAADLGVSVLVATASRRLTRLTG